MSDEDWVSDLAKTAEVTRGELLARRAERGAAEGGLAVVVYCRDGVRAAPLHEGEGLVVGRSHPSDLPIREPSLSRVHARFELVDGVVWVEDLASTNGTRIDGTPVERERVEEGVEVMLGAVVATVQRLAYAEIASFGLAGHDGFVREVETEVRRALRYGRPLSMMMVRSDRRAGQYPARWLPRLRRELEPFHRVALYGPSTVEVLLPEATEEEAGELARRAVAGPEELHVGVAALSDRLRSADALLEAAVEALRRACPRPSVVGDPGGGVRAELDAPGLGGPVARSPAMRELFTTVARLATSVIPVLIEGETGTGKEVVARAIHEGGQRRGRPFVAVNCAAIPPQLVEATLFGHEKGAFTGASQRAAGVFEAAQGGSVLLDEVGELPPLAQAALLRVLESKRVTRVGSTAEVEVDARVLAATHRDLAAMCAAGTFREDLFYRLDAMALRVPPLRERLEEVEPLAQAFVFQANEANGCEVRGIAPAVLELLLRYRWPGNVRELRNVMERAVVIAERATLEVEDLPERIRQLGRGPTGRGASREADGGRAPAQEADVVDLRGEVARFEADLIRRALERHGWDRRAAASALVLPVRTLTNKMHAHGLAKDRSS